MTLMDVDLKLGKVGEEGARGGSWEAMNSLDRVAVGVDVAIKGERLIVSSQI